MCYSLTADEYLTPLTVFASNVYYTDSHKVDIAFPPVFKKRENV